jgi:hypothetical protein
MIKNADDDAQTLEALRRGRDTMCGKAVLIEPTS